VYIFSFIGFFIFAISGFAQGMDSNIPWHFPGKKNSRFPIIANGIIKYKNVGTNAYIAENDTIKKYLGKVLLANFTSVIINCNPSNIEKRSGDYFNTVLRCVKELNENQNDQSLNLMIYDNRFNGGFPLFGMIDAKNNYSDSSVYGFFIDEPKYNEFSNVERWVKGFNNRDTSSWLYNKLLYVNSYGFHVYSDVYDKYINEWINEKPRVLSFDNYSLWDDDHAKEYGLMIGGDLTKDYFVNLEIFKQYSQKYKLPFWNWVLVHRHWSTYSKRFYRRATLADIRFQVYSSLAYGAKGILYYNFWNSPDAKENSWHEEKGILDYDGEGTELYNEVKQVNANIRSLSDLLLNLECIGVYHASNSIWSESKNIYEKNWELLYDPQSNDIRKKYGIKLSLWNSPSQLPESNLVNKIITGMNNPNGMAGQFYHAISKDIYILIVNKNRFSNQIIDVELKTEGLSDPQNTYLRNVLTNEKIIGSHKNDPNRVQFKIKMQSGDGILFKLM
jgi:hypothetical protein